MNRPGNGTARRMIAALLLVVIAFVGVSACTVPRATTVTSEDRQHAKDAAAAAALFEERMRICTSTKPGWDEARCKATESQVAKANEALQYVPDVCSKYPVDEDTCADAIVAKRVKNGEVSPYDTVISPWRTAALVGGIVLALIVLGGCALVLLRRNPQPANRAARPTKPRRSTPQVQPSRQTVRRPSPPAAAAPSAPAPVPGRPMSPHVPQPQQTPPLPHVITGEVVGYTPPPAAPAREPSKLTLPAIRLPRPNAATFATIGVSLLVVVAWMTAWHFVAQGRDDNTQPIYGKDGSKRTITPYADSFGDITPTLLLVIVVTIILLVAALALASKPARRWISLRRIEGDLPAQQKKLIVLVAAGALIGVGFTAAGFITSALMDDRASKESGVCMVRGDTHHSSCR